MDSSYSYVLCSSAAEINAGDWQAVSDFHGTPYMDLRFIRAVETSLHDPGKYWFVIFYDETQRPVACACYSLFLVDGGLLSPPAMQRLIEKVRKVWSRFFRFKLLLQGLPVTTGESQLAVVPGTDMVKLAALLDEIACRLARAEGANFISVKELDEAGVALLAPLTNHGYRLADNVLTWTLKNEFASFDDYYNTRSKRTRANMRKYMKRFEEAGLRHVHLKGGDGADAIFTDDVHKLYLAVFRKAEVQFELLPAGFFREIARQLPDDSRFTFIYRGDRVVGFAMGVNSREMHFLLLCGIDYEVNAESDLYFNLLYRALEFAIADQTPLIRVGASADEFKKRLGSDAKRLYFYMKASRWWVAAIFNRVFHLVFPPAKPQAVDVAEEKRDAKPSRGAAKPQAAGMTD